MYMISSSKIGSGRKEWLLGSLSKYFERRSLTIRRGAYAIKRIVSYQYSCIYSFNYIFIFTLNTLIYLINCGNN